MKIAIMQPYFFPYIGYFQLIANVDAFVIYDNIQYSKKGWINRNRILINGNDEYITLPLTKDSDFLDIDKRFLAKTFQNEKHKLLAKIENNYRAAPQFEKIFPIIKNIIYFEENNLFKFIYNSLSTICDFLEIKTEILISSTIEINHDLKAKEKIIALCKALNAEKYLNPIGGLDFYHKEYFQSKGVELNFLKSEKIEYKQFDNDFVPWLSIIDVLMFNEIDKVKEMLNKFEIL